MTIPPSQAEAAALLARITGDATPVETHISAVFVGGGRALKLKKAVALGFLDFTRLADRERFCRRELALNGPAAPGLYRAVQPVTRGPDGALRLGGGTEPVEWVLEMAALDPADFLDAVAARGALDAAMQDALADALAGLHARLPPLPANAPAAMAQVIDGNLLAAAAAGLPAEAVAAWGRAARAKLARLAPLLAARATAGRVRRCHGDLHLGNWVLWQGAPVPFDALEFDEALATIDTGYDLAFLLADLEHRLGRASANRVLNRYVARGGDAGLVAALPLWLALRGLIRAHCLQRTGPEGHQDGAAWLAAAQGWLAPAQGRIIAVGGLPGSGKSHLSRRLAPDLGAAPGALVLRSDEIRKRRHGVAPEQRLPAAAYTLNENGALYAEIFTAAEAAARAGHTVIADAAFLEPDQRAGIAAAARLAGARFTGLWLEAPPAVLRERIEARTGDASDADLAVLARARVVGSMAWARVEAGEDALPGALRALAGKG